MSLMSLMSPMSRYRSTHEGMVVAETVTSGSRHPADHDHDLTPGDLEFERPGFLAPSDSPRPVPDTYDRLGSRRSSTESEVDHDPESKHLDFLLARGPLPGNRAVINREFSTEVGTVQHPYTNAQGVKTSMTLVDDDVATPDGADFPVARLSLAETLDESIRLSSRAHGSRLWSTGRDARGLRNAIAGRTTTTTTTYRDLDGDGDLEKVTSGTSGNLTVTRIEGVSTSLSDVDDVLCTLMRAAFIADQPRRRSDGIYPQVRRP